MDIYTVSQINNYLKTRMDSDPLLSSIYIRGELSNYKKYPSGHHYFSMKDEEGTIRCVMFKRDAATLNFRPEDGMQVIAFGRVSVYPASGQYQLYVNKLTAEGLGDLYLAYEQMLDKLEKLGLFDQSHKREIPAYPKRILLITSSSGAAVQDMIRILGARWPMCEVLILPVSVQGENAPGEIAAALRWASENVEADLVITGRGGGSMEDLNAFNQEIVARAIYDSRIPVISAVGHETDTTIADFVADLRAATPSNAAELAVPDQSAIRDMLYQLGQRLHRAMDRKLTEQRTRINRLTGSKVLTDPLAYVHDRQMYLDQLESRMISALSQEVAQERKNLAEVSGILTPALLQRLGQERKRVMDSSCRLKPALRLKIDSEQKKLASLAAALDAMSPLKVLSRGYSIARTSEGKVLSSVEESSPGMGFSLRLSDGELSCRVEEILGTEPEKQRI